MNMKKIIASVAASALAVSALAVSAFAADAVTFEDGTGSAVLGDSSKGQGTRITWEKVADILPAGVNINDVYGVQLSFDGTYDATAGMGGSFILSTKGKNWNGVEWGSEGAGKTITYDDATKTLTRLEKEPFFTETDVSGAEGEYAQIVVDCYWGSGTLKVTKLTFVGKDGKEVAASAAPAETTAAEAAPEATTAAEAAPADGTTAAPAADKNTPDTGIEGVAVVAALAVLAGGAVVVAKKRK